MKKNIFIGILGMHLCGSVAFSSERVRMDIGAKALSVEKNQCLNETDPFTLEEINGLDKKDIMFIGKHCFFLPSLFNWVVNKNHSSNPFTREEFTENDKRAIVSKAYDSYPLLINLKWINGKKKEFHVTSLYDVTSLLKICLMQSGHAFSVPSTLYEHMIDLSKTRTKFGFFILDKFIHIGKLLENYRNEQIVSIGISNILDVYIRYNKRPDEQISTNQQLKAIATSLGYSTEQFDKEISLITEILAEAQQQQNYLDARTNEIREMRRRQEL